MAVEKKEVIPALELDLDSLCQTTADWFPTEPRGLGFAFCFGIAYFLVKANPHSQIEINPYQRRLSAKIFLDKEGDRRTVEIGTEGGRFLFRGAVFGALQWCQVVQGRQRDALVIETTVGEFRFVRERGTGDTGVAFEANEKGGFKSFTLFGEEK